MYCAVVGGKKNLHIYIPSCQFSCANGLLVIDIKPKKRDLPMDFFFLHLLIHHSPY
jgi:hypothetical protein